MSDNATIGWERLNCPFFATTCRRILSDYFEAQGLVEKEMTPIGGIVYGRLNMFLEISYEPEMCPNYSPTIIMGIGPSKFDEDGRPTGVPFWYVIPSNRPERSYAFWTFKTETDLESVFVRIKDALVEPYAKSLWLNLDRLEKYIQNFRAEY